jgi:sugar lactone lactonase YvrE
MLLRRWFAGLVAAFTVILGPAGAHRSPVFAFADTPEDKPQEVRLEPRRLPGVQRTGEILLPMQWSLRPAGKQLKLGDFPVNLVLHPKEPWGAVLHAGYGEHEVVIVDLKAQKVVSRAIIPETFYGLCFSPDGTQVFASGAEREVVHQFAFSKGYLSEHRELKIADPKAKFIPAGLACSADGKTLYVACAWGDSIAILPLDAPDNLQHVSLDKGSYPYTVLPAGDGKRLYISLWGAAGVAVLNLETHKVEATWPTESHPTELVLSPKADVLYVACANSNSVHVIDVESGKGLEVIGSSLYPNAPVGSTPNSLALSPDGKVLLIANADNNNLAMFDVSERGKSHSLGYIPVGWYPTSVRFDADQRILVTNGKGLMSKENRQGPNPFRDPPLSIREYIAGLFRGTLSFIEPPAPAEMAGYTRTAYGCSPLRADLAPRKKTREAGHPIPAKLGESSPIKHCIYIVKENRTYDQVFGDMREGNGDPDLCIFPEKTTPNHHALAREFVLLDNFYVESEVSADGHEWSMAAYASDYVEKAWPLVYRGGKKIGYPAEGQQPIAFSAGGYIWDRCKEANVSYRSYGEFVENGKTPKDPSTTLVKSLEGHFDPHYRGYDLDYKDTDRAARFIEQLKGYEESGDLPQFIVLRLPSDHTYGTSAGKRTPTAMVADNDLALGQLIEALSNSKFWKETAVFVVEDDAQNGSDHVDAHRTVAMVISPYTKRKFVDSTMYSTSSMLRTMELILGLKPMSQFDAAALPMYASFQAKPDLTPYKHRAAQVDLEEKNQKTAWGAALSEKLDFSKEDAADDLLLNEIVWRSVRGADSRMPPPVRASFVFAHPDDDDDEHEDDDDD